MDKPGIVVILGPTASGKSALAMEAALKFNGEIVNADSMQVYRHMDIGTAKPPTADRSRVPHHLIDIVDPDEDYGAYRYRTDAGRAVTDIASRGRVPMVAGGTGLYIKALTMGLFEGPGGDPALRDELVRLAQVNGREYLYGRLKEVDPVAASSIHPNNLKRVIRALEVYETSGRPISDFQKEHSFNESPYRALKIGLARDRAALYEAIDRRVERMIGEGFEEEVRGLLAMGYRRDLKPMCGLGYKEMIGFIDGETSLDEAVYLIKRNTRHYAKRQLTWFRKDPGTRWFHPEDAERILECIKRHLTD